MAQRTITRVLDGEHVISESNGRRSREGIVLAANANFLPAGLVLGKLTASGQYAPLDPAAAGTGAETAAAVLFAGRDKSPGSVQKAVAHVRDCELNLNKVTWPSGISAGQKTAAIAALAASGCLLRS